MNNICGNYRKFATLATMNILDIRTTWIFQMVFGMVTPFGLMFFIKMNLETTDPFQLSKILSGNIVISLTMPILLLLTSRLATLKRDGSLDYYRTMPIDMNGFILSLIISFFVTYIPSIIVIFFLGSLILGVKIAGITSLIITFIVQLASILTMVGMAALIGIKSSSPEMANALGNVFFAVLISMSPVLIPDDKIPLILQKIQYVFPTTYSSKLINLSINGMYNNELYIYCLVLLVLCVGSVILLKKVWR